MPSTCSRSFRPVGWLQHTLLAGCVSQVLGEVIWKQVADMTGLWAATGPLLTVTERCWTPLVKGQVCTRIEPLPPAIGLNEDACRAQCVENPACSGMNYYPSFQDCRLFSNADCSPLVNSSMSDVVHQRLQTCEEDTAIMLGPCIDASQPASCPESQVWYSRDAGLSWLRKTNAETPWPKREGHSITKVNSTLVIMGGTVNLERRNDVWASLDLGLTWKQQTSAADWMARNEFGVAVVDNRIVLMGGASFMLFNDVWASDDAGKNWTSLPAAPWSPRLRFGVVALPQHIVLMGGLSEDGLRDDVWSSSDGGQSWVLRSMTSPWTARAYPAVVPLSDDSIILFGGSDVNGAKSDVWRGTYTGRVWTAVQGVSAWAPRSMIGYGRLRNNSILLVGGRASSPYMDVWVTALFTSTTTTTSTTSTSTSSTTTTDFTSNSTDSMSTTATAVAFTEPSGTTSTTSKAVQTTLTTTIFDVLPMFPEDPSQLTGQEFLSITSTITTTAHQMSGYTGMSVSVGTPAPQETDLSWMLVGLGCGIAAVTAVALIAGLTLRALGIIGGGSAPVTNFDSIGATSSSATPGSSRGSPSPQRKNMASPQRPPPRFETPVKKPSSGTVSGKQDGTGTSRTMTPSSAQSSATRTPLRGGVGLHDTD